MQTTPEAAFPKAQDCVLRYLLERRAASTPDRIFATFGWDIPDWTYAETLAMVRTTAAMLKRCGVGCADHVLSWQPNGPGAILAWLAINYVGAVYVPLNLAFRGGILEHAIALSDASLMIAHPDLLDRLRDIRTAKLRTVVIDGATDIDLGEIKVVRAADLMQPADGGAPTPDEDIRPWDTSAIIYTSGTTGPSKAVLSSYMQLYTSAISNVVPLTGDERGLVHSPLFHVTGMVAIFRALATGGSVAVLERFKTDTFWRDVRKTGATMSVIMGSIAAFLLKLPASDAEAHTPLKSLCISPLTPDGRALAHRIGADYHTVFSMSETSRPLMSGLNPLKDGTCGRPRAGVQLRVVDENDVEVPPGRVGELIIRCDTPWTMLSGYYKNPTATAEAWRNGWFHTGDAFRADADGEFFFVDRIKDAIRRRGENISSFEVEVEIVSFDTVRDCAAIAVRSEYSEDDVMVVIEPMPGATIDPAALIAYLQPRMAHYMIPRYVRFVAELPRTPTLRVQKHLLRNAGITQDTWDREAAGISIGRERIRSVASPVPL